MDNLMKDILAELKANPNKKFSFSDLRHLQSPNDVRYAMIHLYEGNFPVFGEVESADQNGISMMKSIYYSGE